MQQEYMYAKEKLNSAIKILAIGKGDVRSRLWDAYLVFHTLQESNFPHEFIKDYKWIMSELTKFNPDEDYTEEGIVPATLRRIKNSTGSKIALRLYELNSSIDYYHKNK